MIYNISNFNPAEIIEKLPLQKRKKGNQKTKDTKFYYKDIICAFDIETSLVKTGSHDAGTKKNPRTIDDFVSVMYIWQFQLGLDITVYGRTWDEFNYLVDCLCSALNEDERIVIYVHSLAYEFQFLRDKKILGSRLNEESVFCVKSRTPIKFLCCDDKLEFRCSYIHSNMSLSEFTDKMDVEHKKLSGDEFDYSKTRYSWTPLTDRELEYCFNDVIGLVECLYKECEHDGDNLYTIPLTSTGYVRRDVKHAIQKLPHNYIQKQLPDYSTYRLLREAFRGGNTHASRFYSNKRIDADIYCNDISSSYPNVLLNCKFPITPFREIEENARTIDDIVKLMKKGRAILAQIAIFDVKLADEFFPVPYLSKDKCRNIVNAVYDNGRIISADYLETTVTDVDLKILFDELDDNSHIEIINAMFASYGYLPEQIKDVIRDYFTKKTKLKGVKEEEIQYNKSKAKLNACYGMMAQNPVKLEECYIGGHYITGIHFKDEGGTRCFISEEDAEAMEEDIYFIAHTENIEKSTMPYQWGVWCTCWARERLERAIRICGNDFLYCDTDSVYYIGEHDFSEYNAACIKDSTKNRAFAADKKEIIHYMGVMELDKTAKSFKTMGAKKYAYIDSDGELHITIAGVNKRKGAQELTRWAQQHGMRDGLDAMQDGFIFSDAGGTESVYNDEQLEELEVDGHVIYVPTNVAIKPSTYETGLGDAKGLYKALLEMLLDNDLYKLYRLNWQGAQLPSIEV